MLHGLMEWREIDMSFTAEQNVIGALLMDDSSIGEIYDMVEPEMFANEFFRCAYVEFAKGYDNHYKVDAVVLEQKLRSDIWPTNYIMQEIQKCLNATVTSAAIHSAAKVILKDYKSSKLDSILNAVKISPDKIESQIAGILSELEELQGKRIAKTKTLAEIAAENKGKYFRPQEELELKIGFPKIDDMLGGLEGGDMIVIGARPAVGKSAFVTQVTSFFASQGKQVGFYNLEMQEKQMYERFVVSESGIGLTRLRRAVKFLGDEEERFKKANETLMNRDGIIISTGGRKVSEIRSESRHMGYDVIIVDYLQLLSPDKSYGNRYADVGAISKALKNLAMEMNIPIIALSQMNRASEGREDREPTMSELREAGDIEQDASVIMLLWNLNRDDPTRKGCSIAKNRQGKVGKIVLKFDGDHMKFVETEEDFKTAKEWSAPKSEDNPFR